ncbi:helix-turn-helix domain-containing protein [Pseudalkalibacillus berkeleyi]|uniref:XRE family transcriptional regulator n=1 Tax=Pseudalkalibacillus berkeleyi TaxID=1069813 RepID=A0ABS9H5P5_9BACL|nr:XRE family transcriptional regulator [Pseudalkalibacillus berkeleyi]MCF6139421.1 XRE family transcriptional regulator [Pseudalkalibacillus berkeleyi]
MEHIQSVISDNLMRIRTKRKMSLDELSSITGVSKSLLRQIEKDESNPTISTLWKIANGLKIPFTSLIEYEMPGTEVVRKGEIEPLLEDDGRYRLYPSFTFENQKPFEMYDVELDSGAALQSEPHRPGTIECITVFSGTLTVTIQNKTYSIHEGDSLKFKADNPHTYTNSGNETTKLSMIIYYPET